MHKTHLVKLTLLLQLESRARTASVDELPYVIVNETSELLPYRQALLWEPDTESIIAASGIITPEKNSPYALWSVAMFRNFYDQAQAQQIASFDANDLSAELAVEWDHWVPAFGLWIPLNSPESANRILILFRDTPWSDGETHLLSYLAEAYGHAFARFSTHHASLSWRQHLQNSKNRLIIVALLLVIALYPGRQSVLAPAEVIAHQPNLVRSPLEGVIETFYVQPNDEVKTGQKLFSLDMTQLQSRLKVSEETRDIAQTEYLQTTQQALLLDPAAKAKLASLKIKWDQQIAEVDYVRSLLDRCQVTADRAGIAVFDDPNDWLGRPVTQGEKILAIADPKDVELEIRLPMDDILALETGNPVDFFPNIAPHRPLSAQLSYLSYRTAPTPANVMAYRIKARFTENSELPRLGYHGTAKLYGNHQPLILWLLRKPIRTLRLWMPW